MALKKKSCCYRLIKYLTILILLGSLIGAGFTVPLNIELIKETDTDSALKRYIVYGIIGCLASLIGISLVAVSIDSYCLTLFSGVLMVFMTMVVAGATATTIFVFDRTIWINIAELGVSFLATIFLLLFTGMVKARKSKKRSSIVAPFTGGEAGSVPPVAKIRPQTPIAKELIKAPITKAPDSSELIENNNASPPHPPSPPPPTANERPPSPPTELSTPAVISEPSRPPSPIPDMKQCNKFLGDESLDTKPESIIEESEDLETGTVKEQF